MAPSEENQTLVRTFLEAKAGWDTETVVELTADDLIVTGVELYPEELLAAWDWDTLSTLLVEELVDPSWRIDRDAEVENMQYSADRLSLQNLTIDHLTCVSPDAFAYQMTPTYSHDGVINGFPPTGKEVPFPEVGAVHVDDGEVVAHRMVLDLRQFHTELGILPGSSEHAQTHIQFRQVVNRVLRHNIRTDLNVALMHLEEIPDGDLAARVRNPLRELQATTEKVRRVEEVIRTRHEPTSVTPAALVHSVVEELRVAYPESAPTVKASDSDLRITAKRPLVRLAVQEAIENAIVHVPDATPEIEVNRPASEGDSAGVIITVSDTGPGIPETEVAPLSREHEDSLEHASGIGLWAIKWSVDQLGGTVEFADNDPNGTVVHLFFPEID